MGVRRDKKMKAAAMVADRGRRFAREALALVGLPASDELVGEVRRLAEGIRELRRQRRARRGGVRGVHLWPGDFLPGAAYAEMVRRRRRQLREAAEKAAREARLRRLIQAELRRRGFHREKTTPSGSNYYFRVIEVAGQPRREVVRLSDHEVPWTDARARAAENGAFTWALAGGLILDEVYERFVEDQGLDLAAAAAAAVAAELGEEEK